jgi:penicillin-binding protein 2
MVFLTIIPAALTVVFILALYNLQIVHGDEYFEHSRNNVVSTETIPASRGGIYDRYGRPLVGTRVSYNLAVSREKLVAADDPNGWLLKMIDYANSLDVAYNDTFPLEREAPYGIIGDMTETQFTRFTNYLKLRRLDFDEITGAELIKFLREHYSVPKGYTGDQARAVIGVRYELELRTLFNYSTYYFAEDVGADLIVLLEEQGFPGISLVPVSVPEYYTKYAAHLLGRVGPMSDREYTKYKLDGYPMDAQVGKDGLEAAFEAELHGSDGVRVITRNPSGTITDVLYTTEPKPGNNIRTTIDIELQQVAEQELETTIAKINADRIALAKEKGKDLNLVQESPGGAVVVIDVRNGEVLASASYPTFDITTMSKNYSLLSSDPAAPLYNRAIQGAYEPGSTFKMVTALGALNENVISDGTIIHDAGKYTKYEGDGYSPTCALYPYGSHGDINVIEALAESCNYFFYETGNNLTIDNIAKYAREFGLGSKTGIELAQYENPGNVASREYKEITLAEVDGKKWFPGDTLQAAIGQSYNLFTPIQLACYTAAIADSGTRYAAHYLKEVKTHDNSQIVTSYEPYILGKVNAEERHFQTLQLGMQGVASYGTAESIFGLYPVKVAAKTGTVQFGEELENNAVFVAYAPADNPQIAVAVVVEKGGSGSGVAGVARGLFDYYFASTLSTRGLPDDGILLK